MITARRGSLRLDNLFRMRFVIAVTDIDHRFGHRRKTADIIHSYFPVPHLPVSPFPTGKCGTGRYGSISSEAPALAVFALQILVGVGDVCDLALLAVVVDAFALTGLHSHDAEEHRF